MIQTLLTRAMGKIFGIFALILSIFGLGYLKGKKKEKELENIIQDQQEEINEIQEQAKETIKNQKEVILDAKNIEEHEAKIAEEKKEEAKKKRKYNLGQWIIIIGFVFSFTACTKTVVQKEYIKIPCPYLPTFHRPNLHNIEIYPGMVIDNETFNKIVDNDIALKLLIKQYEQLLEKYNERFAK